MHGMPKMLVTASAKPDFLDLPGLVADRCGAGHALKTLGILKLAAVATDLSQQSGR
ncbi:MAG: hypothetical protein DVB23_003004, partial [Verrucomicrobia bacterium]